MAVNYEDNNIKLALEWIQDKLNEGEDKEYLENPMKGKGGSLSIFLSVMNEAHGWEVTEKDWLQLVQKEIEDHQERIEFKVIEEKTVVVSLGEDNTLKAPKHKTSSWQKYRKVLSQKGFDQNTIDSIEKDSEQILKKLSLSTEQDNPIKGMVVGSVQSGKTTNMAALMSMAADYGWNVFIVLTGMIDNLRKQTQDRLFNELAKTNGSVKWDIIENPTMDGTTIKVPQILDFKHTQYMIVSLKQKNRLEGLLDWMSSTPSKMKDMKVLVIDDEADQASVNTSDLTTEERKTINNLIVNLVNGCSKKGEPLNTPYGAMNYVGYTATPYANVLSESADESLYPKDFIALLKQSPNYMGPQQIFGVLGEEKYPGLDIIRNVDLVGDAEFEQISSVHEGSSITLPVGLKQSIAYFIAAAASLRLHNFGSPVSMLVHTSVRKEHHTNLALAIKNWLQSHRDEVLQLSEKIWEEERKRFTLDHFKESMPYYEVDLSLSYQPHPFLEIRDTINEILDEIAPISSPNKGKYEYHKGIHLCVDNSEYNRIVGEDEHYRLVYPTDSQTNDNTPVFLVVGGATLSRGLTLEGLITTYFLRNSGQADTLMQMGRWFGYRIRYELYPRLWMTSRTQEQFSYLSELDYSLREEIIEHNSLGKTPKEVGVRIRTAPKGVQLKVTSTNKQRGAIESDYDFTGASIQTTVFENDPSIMKHNLDMMTEFIDSLGQPIILNENSSPSVFWSSISFSHIKSFLMDYKFSERMRVGNNIEAFISWVETMTLDNRLSDWNVIAIGKGQVNAKGNDWVQKHFTWNKVERSKQKHSKVEDIRIQSLRAPIDMYKDIDIEAVDDPDLVQMIERAHTANYLEVRERLGLQTTPQMMLYRISKDSKSNEKSRTREDLNTPYDLAGIYISIPGGRRSENYVSHLVISLEDNFIDLDIKDVD